MSNWTAKITDSFKNPDGETITFSFDLTDGKSVIQFGPFKASDQDAVRKTLLDHEAFANRRDAQIAAIAAFDPASLIGKTAAELQQEFEDANKPPEKTQRQQEDQAFQQALQTYIKIEAALTNATAGKLETAVTTKDVSDAFVIFKATLIHDEYLTMIPKGFAWP